MTILRVALVSLCFMGSHGSAEVNLLPQGDFANPGVNTGWAELRERTSNRAQHGGKLTLVENGTPLQRPGETCEGSRGPLHFNQPQLLSSRWGPPQDLAHASCLR